MLQIVKKPLMLCLLACGMVVGCDAKPHVSDLEMQESESIKNVKAQTGKPAHRQVIVVGAGVSGLAAAKELNDNGYQVVVLEARDRIGGRIWTNRNSEGLALDMGASWIHGKRGNPIHRLAQKLELPLLVTDYDNLKLFDPTGAIDSRHKKWSKLASAVYRAVGNSDEDSVEDAVEPILSMAIENGKFTQAEVNYFINTSIEHEFASDAELLSTEAIEEGEGFRGPDVLFPNGYDQITEHLAKGVEILLEHPVTKVDYSDETIAVTTKSGTVLAADRVIITVPLGVLKTNRIEFVPSLPAEKTAAIESLGMGVLDKLYLQFPHVFWDADKDIFGFVAETKGRWCEWYNLTKPTEQPILLGFVAGEYAERMESLTDEQVVDDAMSVLKAMFGNDIPKPSRILFTRWRADTYAGGSYSYLKSGSSSAMRATLAEPLKNRVFFAGEATDNDYPATIHGAFNSGLRAARSIQDRLENAR